MESIAMNGNDIQAIPRYAAADEIAVNENMQSNNNINYASSIDRTAVDNLKKAPPPPVVATNESTANELSLSIHQDKTSPSASSVKISAPITVVAPTYQSSEESIYYQTAKALLKSGDFETALSTIEEGIEWTRTQLLSLSGPNNNNDKSDLDVCSLHESMAPFHYLYGTTLLYSIEESTDGLQPLTTVEGQSVAVATHDDEGDENVPYESGYENDDPEGENAAEERPLVEDMEIAWENLDTARTILEQVLVQNPTSDKLRADMAQILLREGDLQRQNGANTAAVTDYTSCLSFYENNTAIPKFSRKIADVHCNLGSVYFNLVVEAKKSPSEGSDIVSPDTMTAALEERDLPAKIKFYRNRGFYHHYECAKALVGIMSVYVNVDPFELFKRVEVQQPSPTSFCDEQSDDYPKMIRAKLLSLRQMLTTFPKLAEPLSLQVSDDVNDCLAALEEIQETMDEAEASEQGVVEATAMKEEITAMVSSQQQHAISEEASIPSAAAFGSASATASTALAQPIMVVKKKKKRTEEEILDDDGIDTKLPAIQDPNKKVKTCE
jgi:tetratricopeptide (TPR) repeat protein